MIKNILFDMGQVLIRWEPKMFLDRLGLCDEEAQILNNEVFHSVEWIRLDRGTLDDEGALALMLPRIPAHLHAAASELVKKWDRPRIQIQSTCDIVKELSDKGYGLYLLSNASLRHPQYWPTVPVSQYFGDRLMISSQWKLLKPELAFYQKALEMFQLDPDECLFIDDNNMNVEAAQICNIHGIVYHQDPELLRTRMREFGVDI